MMIVFFFVNIMKYKKLFKKSIGLIQWNNKIDNLIENSSFVEKIVNCVGNINLLLERWLGLSCLMSKFREVLNLQIIWWFG